MTNILIEQGYKKSLNWASPDPYQDSPKSARADFLNYHGFLLADLGDVSDSDGRDGTFPSSHRLFPIKILRNMETE